MDRILVALNTMADNNAVTRFAFYLSYLAKSPLFGLVIDAEQQAKACTDSIALRIAAGGYSEAEKGCTVPCDTTRDFESLCDTKGIRFNTKTISTSLARNIINESRFADLLLIPNHLGMAATTSRGTSFIQRIVDEAACPVIIVPSASSRIDEIIFLYDGSAEAVFSIKQFIHLFPGFTDKRFRVVCIHCADQPGAYDRLRHLLQQHYSAIGYEVSEDDVDAALDRALRLRRNAILVTGRYGFDAVVKRLQTKQAKPALPIFITNR